MPNRLSSTSDRRPTRAERARRALDQVGRVLTSQANAAEAIEALIDLALPLLEMETAAVFVLSDDGAQLRLLTERRWPAEVVAQLDHLGLDAPLLAARAVTTRQLQLVGDPHHLPDELALTQRVAATQRLGIVLAVPLLALRGLVGAVEFGRARQGPLEEDEITFVQSYCSLLACGLDHAWDHQAVRDYEEKVRALHKRVRRLSTLQRVARLIQRNDLSIDQVLREFLKITQSAWQFPDLASVRLAFAGQELATPRFVETPWKQQARLVAPGGHAGVLEVTYREERPFLSEELVLLTSLAELLETYLEREHAVAELRASEERFRRLVANAGDIIFRYEIWPIRGYSYVSPACTRVTGYTPEEHYADPDLILKVVHPDDQPVLEGVLLGQPVPRSILLRWRHKQGYYVGIEEQLVPIYHANGQLVAIEGIARDITERQRGEEERAHLLAREQAARREAEAERARLETIFDSAPHAIIFVDAATRYIRANPKAVELFGRTFTPESGQAQYVGQVCQPDGHPLSIDELPATLALRGVSVQDQEGLLIRPDGRRVPVLLSAAPVVSPRGEIMGAVKTIQDITVLKELERLREEWTSVIAHDLRQPVTVVSGYAGLLCRQADRAMAPTQTKQAAEHILASARQLNRMISDLLDASRLEAGRLHLEHQMVDLPELVQTVLERMAEIMNGHPVHVDVRSEIPRLRVDPGRIEQVMGNLLSNAAKYSDPGTEIRVCMERREGEVVVAVRNHGPGIHPEDLPGLFTRFHRGRHLRSGQSTGLGLGLYITQGLVRAHGGRIWAESVPSQVTTFFFTLPLDHPGGVRLARPR